MPTLTFSNEQIKIIKMALLKMKPVQLGKDCTCPVCGFKTMANYCRECGQALAGDEINSNSHDRKPKTYCVYDGEKAVFKGQKRAVCEFIGCNITSFNNKKFRSKPINGYMVVEV